MQALPPGGERAARGEDSLPAIELGPREAAIPEDGHGRRPLAAGHHAGATDLEELDNRLSLFVRKTPDAVQGAVDRVEILAHSSGWLSSHDCILFIFYITYS